MNKSEMIVGAIVLYDASPMPTIARKRANVSKVGIYDPINVVALQSATPAIMFHRLEYRSPRYPKTGAHIMYDITNVVCRRPPLLSSILNFSCISGRTPGPFWKYQKKNIVHKIKIF